MPDPTGRISHFPDAHRGVAWKEPVRVATTGNITLSGTQTIDGIAVVAGDRVLVKDQTTGSQNGLYLCAAGAWTRTFDMDQDATSSVPAEEVRGAVVEVLEGTVNGGTFWRTTNTAVPTLGTTAITWVQWAAGAVLTIKDEGAALAVAPTSIDFVGAGVTASGTGAAKTVRVTSYEPLTSGANSAPELVFTADGRCIMVPVAD